MKFRKLCLEALESRDVPAGIDPTMMPVDAYTSTPPVVVDTTAAPVVAPAVVTVPNSYYVPYNPTPCGVLLDGGGQPSVNPILDSNATTTTPEPTAAQLQLHAYTVQWLYPPMLP